jgi:hypothetical protein
MLVLSPSQSQALTGRPWPLKVRHRYGVSRSLPEAVQAQVWAFDRLPGVAAGVLPVFSAEAFRCPPSATQSTLCQLPTRLRVSRCDHRAVILETVASALPSPCLLISIGSLAQSGRVAFNVSKFVRIQKRLKHGTSPQFAQAEAKGSSSHC